jgi:hypothetical protein
VAVNPLINGIDEKYPCRIAAGKVSDGSVNTRKRKYITNI